MKTGFAFTMIPALIEDVNWTARNTPDPMQKMPNAPSPAIRGHSAAARFRSRLRPLSMR